MSLATHAPKGAWQAVRSALQLAIGRLANAAKLLADYSVQKRSDTHEWMQDNASSANIVSLRFVRCQGAQSKRLFMQALNREMSERSRSFIHPAGRNVELFNEMVFSALRSMASVPDDFINDGWDFSTFQHGGGKGGSMMAFVEDKFIIKELSPGDHKSLLELAPAYGRHVNRGITTLLSPIYLHFRDEESGKFYFAMKNTIGRGPFKACYDLKGCADDKLMEKSGEKVKAVHKRIWNVGMWCGQRNWTEERKRYYAGKLEARSVQIGLLREQRQNLLDALKRDTDFLAGHKLMDYSFLVAIKESPPGSTSSNHLQPFRYLRRLPCTWPSLTFCKFGRLAKGLQGASKYASAIRRQYHPSPMLGAL
eukprot:s3619_g6.t1